MTIDELIACHGQKSKTINRLKSLNAYKDNRLSLQSTEQSTFVESTLDKATGEGGWLTKLPAVGQAVIRDHLKRVEHRQKHGHGKGALKWSKETIMWTLRASLIMGDTKMGVLRQESRDIAFLRHLKIL